MSHEAFLTDLAEVLEVEPEELAPDYALSEDKWDSLAIFSTIALIDEHFEVTVQGKALASCATISELLQLIDGRVDS